MFQLQQFRYELTYWNSYNTVVSGVFNDNTVLNGKSGNFYCGKLASYALKMLPREGEGKSVTSFIDDPLIYRDFFRVLSL